MPLVVDEITDILAAASVGVGALAVLAPALPAALVPAAPHLTASPSSTRIPLVAHTTPGARHLRLTRARSRVAS